MALAVRSSSITWDTATGLEPTGAASGDLLVMMIHSPNTTTAFTPPTGWTEVLDTFNHNTDNGRKGAFWIIRAGSAPSYTIGGGNGGAISIVVYAITGHDATTPMDATPTENRTTGVDAVCASITTVTADTLILLSIGNNAATGTPFAQPSGFTLAQARDSYAATAYKAQAATGATGTFTWDTHADEWGCITVAVRPSGGGGGATLRRYSLGLTGVG